MSSDDYHVILYKVLAYLYGCMKEGVAPSIERAQTLAKVNEGYWVRAVLMMQQNGYIEGLYVPDYKCNSSAAWHATDRLGITEKGIDHLIGNSLMAKAASLLGNAFPAAIQAAVELTRLL